MDHSFASLSFRIFLLFLPMACLGTLSHELGHIAVAQWRGYPTTLHYASMNYYSAPREQNRMLWKEYKEGRRNYTAREKEEWKRLGARAWRDEIVIAMGGPLQTMLTGTLGLLLLWRLRSRPDRKASTTFTRGEWGGLLLTLFWSRQIFNGITGGVRSIFDIHRATWGDEIKLAYLWQLPLWSLALGTALIGSAVCLYAIFRLTPNRLRLPLCLGGIAGSLIGYVIWMKLIGPMALP